jgi:radical SAM superfamily enzyme YgiQ (UPF0313 family)
VRRSGLSPGVVASPQPARVCDATRPVVLVGFQNLGNLGLGYLSAVLRQRGYLVQVVDIERPPGEILHIAQTLNPLLMGFSLIFQFHLPRYAALLSVLRAYGVTCHFTMGGHFPSLSPRETLGLIPDLDTVVRFEGETTLAELADAIAAGKDWRTIEGIAYKDGDEVVSTPARPLARDLDLLPYPDRDYEPDAVLGKTVVPILASRGCARTCAFCSIHTFYRSAPGRVVRTRRPAEVVAEMRWLHEHRGAAIFLFQDDDFPLVGPVWRRWAGTFVDELHKSGLPGKVVWKISCRADAVEPALFAKMREAGLYLVYMGLESGSQQGLAALHKQMSVEQNLRAIDVLRRVGLAWHYGFMLLDPSSTFETVAENLAFLRTITADGTLPVMFCRMVPYDGTAIKDELVRAGRLRGDVCNPDYDFIDPRLTEFHRELSDVVSQERWIHGPDAAGLQLVSAWHEVAVLERLFPALPGMGRYKGRLRSMTRASNHAVLSALDTLAAAHADGRRGAIDGARLEATRQRLMNRLLAERDGFIGRHQHQLLSALA